MPIEEVCRLTPQCSVPCHITKSLITAKLQNHYNENFQGGKDQATVMLEAVHVGQLAQISQCRAREAKVKVDPGMGQLVLHGRKKGPRSQARVCILLSYPAKAGIGDQKQVGEKTWEDLKPILTTRTDI